MRESDFWSLYRHAQQRVNTPTELKERTARAVHAAHEAPAESSSFASSKGGKQDERRANLMHLNRAHATRERPHAQRAPRRARIAYAAAACVAALALAGGTALLSTGVLGFGASDQDQPAILAEALDAFTVKAYATDANEPISVGADGSIVLSCLPNIMAPSISSQDATNAYEQEGYYTGCLFRVEGEGIARIQASLSEGVIYRSEIREYTAADDPEILIDLARWKPEARGTGTFAAYDMVLPTGYDDGVPADSPEAKTRVQLVKKLGQTIDIDLASTGESADDCLFGLWTNKPLDASTADEENPSIRLIDQLDGETLTITVTFEDGSTATQVLELHGANVLGSSTLSDDGAVMLDVTTEFLDDETITAQGLEYGTDYIHVLRATVVESNTEPFPGSLENANDLADHVEVTASFERAPIKQPAQWVDESGTLHDTTLEDLDVIDASEPVTITPAAEFGTLTVSNVRIAYRGSTLPDGITLADLDNGMSGANGDLSYFNRVTGQMDGYTIDENGIPSEG